MNYKASLFFIILFFPFALCNAQINLGDPSVMGKPAPSLILRDYEAIGINPSNLAWNNNNRFSFGLIYLDATLESKALSKDEIIDAFRNMGNDFTQSDKSKYALLFNSKDGINLNSNIIWTAFSLNLNRFGGIGVNFRDRFIAHFSANKAFSDVLFNGYNSPIFDDPDYFALKVADIFNGTDLKFQHLREFNLSYGVKITQLFDIFKIYGGFGYRYIWGLGCLSVSAQNGILNARSAINGSDFKIDMGVVDSLKISNASASAQKIFNSAGLGSAFDFGVSILILDKIKFAASVSDIGSVNWSKNTLRGENIYLKNLNPDQQGLENFNVIKQAGYLFNKDGLLQFRESHSFKTDLPSLMRLGAGIRLGKIIDLGADLCTAVNDAYGYKGRKFYSLGAELNIFKIIKINSGITGNSDIGWNVPIGITLSTRGYYEIYFASNDILTLYDRTKNPFLSGGFCALKFNIPGKIRKESPPPKN